MKFIFDWEEGKYFMYPTIVHYAVDSKFNVAVASISERIEGSIAAQYKYVANFDGAVHYFSNIDDARSAADKRLIEMNYKILSLAYRSLL